MNVMIGNKSPLGCWVTLISTQVLGDEGPETQLMLYFTENPVDPAAIRNGKLEFCERLEAKGILRRAGIPDTSRRPSLRGDVDFGGRGATIFLKEDEGETHLLITIHADAPKTAPDTDDDGGNASPDEDLPRSIRTKNGLDRPVCVTYFVAPFDPGDGSFLLALLARNPPLMLMVMVTAKRPEEEMLRGAHILRQRMVKPGRAITLKQVPKVNAVSVYIEDGLGEIKTTEESEGNDILLRVNVVPMEPDEPE